MNDASLTLPLVGDDNSNAHREPKAELDYNLPGISFKPRRVWLEFKSKMIAFVRR